VPVGHTYFGKISPCPKCNQATIDAACGLKTHERRVNLAQLITTNRPGAQAMKEAGQQFIANPRGFLSVYGPCGNAKTVLLQAITNACLDNGIEARYLTAHELLDYLKEAFDPRVMETDIGRIHRLASIPVLVIDELDKARNTEYAADMQQHLINERYRNAQTLGTVFAWNGTLNTLPWPAVVSRITEFVHIENGDVDLRPILGAAHA
jgi:DNA replication protein DnaC